MIKLPPHNASLSLTHNDHANYYDTVAKAIANGNFGYEDDDWVSEEQKQKAIETDDCWTIQWYPDNPVSFYVMSAADLDVLLSYANGGHQ